MTDQIPTKTEILFDEAATVLYSKGVYYRLMQLNGFYMPQITSSICTLEWMDKIRNEEIWIPKDEELRIKNCPSPPEKLSILREIEKLYKQKGLPSIGWTIDLMPDKQWCLQLLATLDQKHPYFAKDY